MEYDKFMLNKKKILVTGGSGFLGSSLVKWLLKEGHSVRVLDDNSRGRMRRLEDVINDIEFIGGDVRNYEDVLKATKSVDAVAHLAFVNGTEFFYKKPKLVLEVGVKGAIHTLDAAIECNVPEYYLMSSSEVYQQPPIVPTDENVPFFIPDPLNPRYSYGGGKLISELMAINYAREHFQRMVIVRPHNVYGPDMGTEHVIPQFILRAKELVQNNGKQFVIQGDGMQTRSFVYVDDFTDGAGKAFLKGEHMNIYHVGTEDEVTIKNVAEAVLKVTQCDAQIVPTEEPLGATTRRCPNIAKVSSLGYKPKVSLKEGIQLTVPYYYSS